MSVQPGPPPEPPDHAPPDLPSVSRGALAAAGLVALVLTALSGRYGFHRDELYYAMLPQAWGYVDQPPLIPLIANLLGSSPWLLRVPATICAAASVLLMALITRELGGSLRSQTWAAWAYAGTVALLDFGHVMLTSALDLMLWPLICWLVIRAELRDRPRLWLAAGAVAGVATYNKLLVAVLLAGIALGFAVAGPRRRLASPHLIGGALVAVALALPNLIYQVANSFPQLEMGAALAEENAGEVRWFAWVFLVLVLGPVLVPVWIAGLVALWRRPDWRPVRFVAVAFADQVGWPRYVEQVQAVHDGLPAQQRASAAVVTSNYGEAGAVHAFSDLPVYSGHNRLHDLGAPPDGATTVVFVGGQLDGVARLFESCRVVDRLDNGVGVDNEEQGQPVAVCTGPRQSWAQLWPQLRHLD